ncbi:response regulator transcription factor [Herbaspirillum sp. RV1423]|uniref:response regulator transcription factor n=1 Tax=Herbaspirillum sp. RV1423 TaxID=1443993 RepID=UPI0004B69270|nr:response regulator transcription factor [Herbaspirillum sp. RV1423]
MITVLIADDHPLITEGSVSILESDQQKRFAVVGTAATADDAVTKYKTLRPDVVLLDIRFGYANTGIDAAIDIKSAFPDAKIIFVSQLPPETFLLQGYRIGAMAVLVKNCSNQQLIDAVLSASAGEQYFLPKLAERLANIAIGSDPNPRFTLDEREFLVFSKLAEGWNSEEIAAEIGLSPRSVHNISTDIKEKLKVRRPAEITRLAIRSGVIEA